MGTQDIVKLVVQTIASNPQLLSGLMEHPYSTIGNLTNNNNVSKEEASQVVAATSALAKGQNVDFAGLAAAAAGLLANNGNSVHALANSLLGSGVTITEGSAPNKVSNDMISNLAGAVFGNGVAANKIAGVDLSDGFGLDDVIGLAGTFFGAQK